MKRWVPPVTVLVALVILSLGIVTFRSSRGDRPERNVRDSRYNARELLVPQIRYLLPDIEHELVNPFLRYAVDPEMPLPAEILQESREDLREALRRELLPRVEQAVEELLFE